MGLPPFNTRRGFDYGQLVEGVYRLAVKKYGDNPLGLKIGGKMILKDFMLDEFMVSGDDKPKKIIIRAETIIKRPGVYYSIPIYMEFEFKDNGSYFQNFRDSLENFMDLARRQSSLWKVDPKTDKEWKLCPQLGSVNMIKVDNIIH